MIQIAAFIFPIVVGLLINQFLPRVGRVLRRCLRPCIFAMIVFFLTVGVFVNLPIFRLLYAQLVEHSYSRVQLITSFAVCARAEASSGI